MTRTHTVRVFSHSIKSEYRHYLNEGRYPPWLINTLSHHRWRLCAPPTWTACSLDLSDMLRDLVSLKDSEMLHILRCTLLVET